MGLGRSSLYEMPFKHSQQIGSDVFLNEILRSDVQVS